MNSTVKINIPKDKITEFCSKWKITELALLDEAKRRDMTMKFLVTVEQDEAGYFVVECPALPGCISQGRTRGEALTNIQEAILVSLETRHASGLSTDLVVTEVEVAPS